MSTNFYLEEPKCKCCGRQLELHIGKRSAGWKFDAGMERDTLIAFSVIT